MIVNGQKQSQIPITDRGLQYGDGCFTTIAYDNDCLELFDLHLQRLKTSCERLFIPFKNWEVLKHSVFDSLQNKESCVVKIMITRGSGGRGYSPLGADSPNFIISHHSLPEHYQDWQTNGVNVTVSDVTLGRQPLLAGIKHLNRLEQVFIKHSLTTTEFDDAIVCDTDGNIIETSVGNLFWLYKGHWFTPDLINSGVEGVMRNYLLAKMKESGQPAVVVQQPIEVIFKAEAAFICNSLMKVVPIVSVADPITTQIKILQMKPVNDIQNKLLKIGGKLNG